MGILGETDDYMEVSVEAYPFVVSRGTILVPRDVENVDEYVEEHFDDINFDEPDQDFGGCEYNISAIA